MIKFNLSLLETTGTFGIITRVISSYSKMHVLHISSSTTNTLILFEFTQVIMLNVSNEGDSVIVRLIKDLFGERKRLRNRWYGIFLTKFLAAFFFDPAF